MNNTKVENTPIPWDVDERSFQSTTGFLEILGAIEREAPVARVPIRAWARGEATANARLIVQAVNNHEALLAALKAQHEAIDRLFAMLIVRDKEFYPSTSGQPWEAIRLGNEAIAQVAKRDSA